jgi:uncharacterized membrane protein YbhN (UPF0104 family)
VLWTASGARPSGPVLSTPAVLRRIARSPLLRVAGTVAGMVLLARCVDLRSAAITLSGANRLWLAAGAALAAAAFLTAILEWGVWLRASSRRVTWGMVSSWQAQSVFLGSLLPTGAGGDALRAVEAVRATGCGRGLASLVGSRLAGATGMAAWGVAGALALGGGGVGAVALVAAVAWAALLAAAWAAALCAAPAVRRMGGHRRRPVRRLAALLHPLTEAMSWYRGRGGVVGASLAAGAAGWGLHLLSLQALGRAVGIDVSPAVFALLVPVALLATLLPVTVNGMGVREGMLVAMLARYGVDAHRAAVLAVLADLQALPVALVGAGLWFSRRW